jgi:hypothetical protein
MKQILLLFFMLSIQLVHAQLPAPLPRPKQPQQPVLPQSLTPVSVSIFSGKSNVFYIGVDNPLTLSLTGISADDVIVTVNGAGGGSITGSGLNYIVNVTEQTSNDQFGSVTVKHKLTEEQIGLYTFRVKRFPNPIAQLTNNSFDREIFSSDMKVQTGVMAVLQNFDFEVGCKIKSFNLIYIAKNQDPVKIFNEGGRFNSQSEQLVKSAKSGDIYIFSNVIGKCPGDVAGRMLNPLVFFIK